MFLRVGVGGYNFFLVLNLYCVSKVDLSFIFKYGYLIKVWLKGKIILRWFKMFGLRLGKCRWCIKSYIYIKLKGIVGRMECLYVGIF